MGSALPNGNDLEVISQLNDRFSGAKLIELRDYIHTEPDDFLWNRGKKLARAAYRLYIWPTKDPKAKPRWFAFLDRILSKQNRDDIQDALKVAIDDANNNIVGVHFWAQYDASVPPGSYKIRVTDEQADDQGNIFKKITVLTDHEIPTQEKGDRDPPRPTDEKGPVHPFPHTVTKRKKSRRKGGAKKKKAKAMVKRKSGRTSGRKRK